MAPVALLDVNVLVALFFPEHVHHDSAVHMKGALLTFDRSIPMKAVRGATASHLQVIAPVGA